MKTRAEWCAVMEGSDVCFAPVLEIDEAPSYRANVARKVFVEVAGVTQPAPAPRFSATPGAIQGPPPAIGGANVQGLRDWGFGDQRIAELQSKGVI
jgi:alpha-methylacyl-CoA racemase